MNTAAFPSQLGCRHSTSAALQHRPCARQGRSYRAAAPPGPNQPELSTTATETICLTWKHSCRALPPLSPELRLGPLCLCVLAWHWALLRHSDHCTRAQPTLAVSNEPSQWVHLEQACPLYGPFPRHLPECTPKYQGTKLSCSVKS